MKLPGEFLQLGVVFIFNHWSLSWPALPAREGILFRHDPGTRTSTSPNSGGPRSHGILCGVPPGTIPTDESKDGTSWSYATQRPCEGPQVHPPPLTLPPTTPWAHISQLLSLQALYPRERHIITQVLQGSYSNLHGNSILQPTGCTWSLPYISKNSWQGP